MSIVILEPTGLVRLCPGSSITFVCRVSQSNVIVWENYVQGHPDKNRKILTIQSAVGVEFDSGSFTILLSSSLPFVSTATLKDGFNSQQNGTILACSNTVYSVPLPSQIETATLTLRGIFYYVLSVNPTRGEGQGPHFSAS